MRIASAMPHRTARLDPSSSRTSAAPKTLQSRGAIRCSTAAVRARSMSAPQLRARRKAAGLGSRRQASQSSMAVALFTDSAPADAASRHGDGNLVAIVSSRGGNAGSAWGMRCTGIAESVGRGGEKAPAHALPSHCSSRAFCEDPGHADKGRSLRAAQDGGRRAERTTPARDEGVTGCRRSAPSGPDLAASGHRKRVHRRRRGSSVLGRAGDPHRQARGWRHPVGPERQWLGGGLDQRDHGGRYGCRPVRRCQRHS